MILHAAFLNLRSGHDTAELADVMTGLAGLVGRVSGFADFRHGPNIDLEGKSPDHPYGFVCSFEDRAALAAYAADPVHAGLGARLMALCAGGADGIVVYDLELVG